MDRFNQLIRLALQYQDALPIIAFVGSIIFDDFSDFRHASDSDEFLQYLAERLISYLVVFFVLLIVVELLLNDVVTPDLLVDGYDMLI